MNTGGTYHKFKLPLHCLQDSFSVAILVLLVHEKPHLGKPYLDTVLIKYINKFQLFLIEMLP